MLSWFLTNWFWVVGSLTLIVLVFFFFLRLQKSIENDKSDYTNIREQRVLSPKGIEDPFYKREETVQDCLVEDWEETAPVDLAEEWEETALDSTTYDDESAWHNILEEELDRMPLGRIVFNPPSSMKVGIKERVEVRISKDFNVDLAAALKGKGVAQIEDVKVSELMKVRLSGDDFNIASLNEEEQVIGKKGFTEWAWDIVPNKRGEKILHLHVTLRIRLPFGEEKKDCPVLDRDVLVKINPTYSIRLFYLTYWKWIITAVVVPLLGLVWKMFFINGSD